MPTLYINGKEVDARLDDRRVHLERFDYDIDDASEMNVPIFDIDRVVVIGYPKVTMQLLHHFIYKDIPVVFLSTHGRWVSSMLPNTNGNALRRLHQYEAAKDKSLALRVAKALIYAKIRNMRRVLQRLAANRELSREDDQLDACNTLQAYLLQLDTVADLDVLRGIEGAASARYFRRLAVFFPEEMPFTSRSRRPPRDAANAILSWTYSIVTAEIDAAVKAAGLDSTLGFLHEIAYGRPSLALDLIEPLRAPLCDLLALNLLNHKLLSKDDFENNPDDGGVYLTKYARRRFFMQYEEYMERFFKEDKTSVHVTFRRVIRNMVNTICQVLEARVEPEFFIMP